MDGMDSLLVPAAILREARERAGLTRETLGARAAVDPAMIAEIEDGKRDPGVGELARLVAEAGYELRADLTPIPVADTHMLDDVARILALTPEERLLEVRNVARFAAAARRA